MIKVAVDQPVEQMANVELAGSTGGICITYDVDRAAVGQQMIELRPIGEFVDALQVDKQQFPHIFDGRVEKIKINRFLAIVRAHADKIPSVSHHVEQLELLEERGDRIKALADLRARLDGDTQRWSVVEGEAHECMGNRAFAPVRHKEIKSRQVR